MKSVILPYRGIVPAIHPSCFIAPTAAVIGDVHIGENSSVWFNVTIRGDVNKIRIGARTNIQDGTVIHVDRKKYGTFIGDDTTVGHSAVVHACTVGNGCLIGIKSCVLDGAVIEDGAMVAAGALVTSGKRVLSGQIWAGSPAKYWRDMTEDDYAEIKAGNANYVMLNGEYK
jgi:carbonic anhydrase/acetyltransferase-like protein (isoleucine patch superfamily)